MNVVKRPRGGRLERPADLRERLGHHWDAHVARSLAARSDPEAGDPDTDTGTITETDNRGESGQTGSETDSGTGRGEHSLQVNIGRPRLDSSYLLENRARILDWISDWQNAAPGAPVVFETFTLRRTGPITVPTQIVFHTVDEMATFLGARAIAALTCVRQRLDRLTEIDPRLAAMTPHWRGLCEVSETEMAGIAAMIAAWRGTRREALDIRELAIPGLDTKWIEAHAGLVRAILRCIDGLVDAETPRAQLGFRDDDRREVWMKLHPDDMPMPLGGREFAMRPSEITTLPANVTRAVIVENKATFNSHAPLPGVCLFFGAGNAISGALPSMDVLRNLDLVYWGDLDSFGMKILSRVRESMPHTRSMLMDIETMDRHAPLWTREEGDARFKGDIPNLTRAEAEALERIRKGNNRLEQERIEPDATILAAMGLGRVS